MTTECSSSTETTKPSFVKMQNFEKIMRYPLKKRKRFLFTAICCVMAVYGGVHLLYLQDDYSPLQLLSSVENEATRLLRFMVQTQVQCNYTLSTNNASTWVLCQDADFGMATVGSEDQSAVVYSVGPSPDFSFEQVVSRNLSSKLFIFSHLISRMEFLAKANPNVVYLYKTSIVANDPADFARNSFDTQTLNSVMANLDHKDIDILKIDTLAETVHSDEVLRFLIDDSVLIHVKELHVVLKLDKVEEDYIYNWYRVLYALFHKSGFRLYHTAASDPLCLQDTIMESCKYFLSWIHRPQPHVFVLYPPAIDGSYQYEKERMLMFLDEVSSKDGHFVPVTFSLVSKQPGHDLATRSKNLTINLSQNVLKKDAHSCSIIFILKGTYHHFVEKDSNKPVNCHSHFFVYIPASSSSTSPHFLPLHSKSSSKKEELNIVSLDSIQHILTSSSANILYLEISQSWDLINLLSGMDIFKFVDQLIIKTSIIPTTERPQPMLLRRRYSELKRLQEFQLLLLQADKTTTEELKYEPDQDIYTLNFVKSLLLQR